jgi:hypothetical protein
LFVVGGGKEPYIRSEPILAQYFELFRQYILRPNARLMIIGYGFADEHVNKPARMHVEDAKRRT